jgi:hypothetical protein
LRHLWKYLPTYLLEVSRQNDLQTNCFQRIYLPITPFHWSFLPQRSKGKVDYCLARKIYKANWVFSNFISLVELFLDFFTCFCFLDFGTFALSFVNKHGGRRKRHGMKKKSSANENAMLVACSKFEGVR